MEGIVNKEILDNTLQTYIEVFGSIIIAFGVKRFISKYLATILFKIFTKAKKNFHKESFLQLIVGPLESFIFLCILVVASSKLKFPDLLNIRIYKSNLKDIMDAVATMVIIISFIRLCIRLVQFFSMILEEKASSTSDYSDNQLIVFFRDFLRVLFIIFGGLLILKFSFHYNISNLLTGLSIVGAAIALGTKESLENLIASFIIFFDKPFAMGDTVKVQGFTGSIEKIGLRSTRIRTDQKTFITVPNKQMVDSILDNITLRNQRRADLRLELGLSTTAVQLKKIIPAIKMILQKDMIDSSNVMLNDTGKNAHVVSIEYYTSMEQTLAEFNAQRGDIILEIIELLNKNDVTLAASSTDVFVHQNKA
jgi:MscS family membrane protein